MQVRLTANKIMRVCGFWLAVLRVRDELGMGTPLRARAHGIRVQNPKTRMILVQGALSRANTLRVSGLEKPAQNPQGTRRTWGITLGEPLVRMTRTTYRVPMDTAATWAIAISVLAGLPTAAVVVARAMHREAGSLRTAIVRGGGEYRSVQGGATIVGSKPRQAPRMTPEEALRFATGKEPPTLTPEAEAEAEAWARSVIDAAKGRDRSAA